MNRNYERYSNGIFSSNIVNYISNVKIFRQQTLKKEHLTQQELWCSQTLKCGDNT